MLLSNLLFSFHCIGEYRNGPLTLRIYPDLHVLCVSTFCAVQFSHLLIGLRLPGRPISANLPNIPSILLPQVLQYNSRQQICCRSLARVNFFTFSSQTCSISDILDPPCIFKKSQQMSGLWAVSNKLIHLKVKYVKLFAGN